MKRREANWTSVAAAGGGGIGAYDAIIDPHCRRDGVSTSLSPHQLAQLFQFVVHFPCPPPKFHRRRSVENHSLKHLLSMTRPDAQVSFSTTNSKPRTRIN
jgi:hypothetical protein